MFTNQGTYIERVEDLLEHFTNLENRVKRQDSQIASLQKQTETSNSERHSLETKIIELNHELASQRTELKQKERECREAQGLKHTSDMKIKKLELNVNDYRQRLNEQIELCEVNCFIFNLIGTFECFDELLRKIL